RVAGVLLLVAEIEREVPLRVGGRFGDEIRALRLHLIVVDDSQREAGIGDRQRGCVLILPMLVDADGHLGKCLETLQAQVPAQSASESVTHRLAPSDCLLPNADAHPRTHASPDVARTLTIGRGRRRTEQRIFSWIVRVGAGSLQTTARWRVLLFL